jgi:dienelactone hydrolase
MYFSDHACLQVGIMGFCYGGGKALAYSTKYKIAKATVVVYGKPVRFYS